MFGHLDINNDGLLSTSELFDLEHDQNERCIKPFIDTCDVDNDGSLSTREWCRCFEKTDRPCAAVRRRIKYDLLAKGVWHLNIWHIRRWKLKSSLIHFFFWHRILDAYVPDCDINGFYRPTQCHSKIGICWCVDKHGVEFANTRKRGRPTCGESFISNYHPKPNASRSFVYSVMPVSSHSPFCKCDFLDEVTKNVVSQPSDDEDDDDLDYDDAEASGNGPISY